MHPTYSEQFHLAITNPAVVHEDILLSLIDRYPYVQALRFAYEKKQYSENQAEQNLSSTLLYAPSPAWLFEYIHRTLSEVEPSADPVVEVVVAEVQSQEEMPLEGEGDTDEPKGELERLIQIGAAQDYFSTAVQSNETLAENSDSRENEPLSVYNDDTLPYSFLWWLHKTRQEYAETYQPYVNTAPSLQASAGAVEHIHAQLDAQLLDQQIRESIFHLQSPEAKLSGDEKITVPFQVSRKSDEVIEKFIREEPVIKPLRPEQLNLENKARKSSEDRYTLVTETLANIYAEQGLYPKAIEVYHKLVLKYPEKNTYFAARIAELEQKLN